MKAVMEEHIKVQGKYEITKPEEERNKDQSFSKEAELRKLIQGKNPLISDPILPILQRVPIMAVSTF